MTRNRYASRVKVGVPRESRRFGTVELSLIFLFFCCIFVGIRVYNFVIELRVSRHALRVKAEKKNKVGRPH